MIPTGLARKLRFSTSDLPLPAMPTAGAAKLLQLKGDRTGLEFIDVPSGGGGGAWGSITGTLSDQTDLQAALDAKASTASVAAKLDASGGILSGTWSIRGGYGSGGLAPWENSGSGQVGVSIVNYFGTACGRLWADNSGNFAISNSAGTGVMVFSGSALASNRFQAIDANGGSAAAPLFVLDNTSGNEGGFYCPISGGVSDAQYWVSARTQRVTLWRSGLFEFNTGLINMGALPTSNPAVVGRLWNDAGTLKVSAG